MDLLEARKAMEKVEVVWRELPSLTAVLPTVGGKRLFRAMMTIEYAEAAAATCSPMPAELVEARTVIAEAAADATDPALHAALCEVIRWLKPATTPR